MQRRGQLEVLKTEFLFKGGSEERNGFGKDLWHSCRRERGSTIVFCVCVCVYVLVCVWVGVCVHARMHFRIETTSNVKRNENYFLVQKNN